MTSMFARWGAQMRLALVLLASSLIVGCGGGGERGEPTWLEVKWAPQSKSLWCWAAVEQMILDAAGISKTQLEISYATKGSDVNQKAEGDEVARGLANASNGVLKAKWHSSRLSMNEVTSALADKKLVIAFYEDFFQGLHYDQTGHFVVVYRYSESPEKLWMLDPDRCSLQEAVRHFSMDDDYVSPTSGRKMSWEGTIVAEFANGSAFRERLVSDSSTSPSALDAIQQVPGVQFQIRCLY